MQMNSRSKKVLGWFLLTFLISFGILTAQDLRNEEVIKKLFEESQTLYDQGKYTECASKLKEIIGLNPSNQLTNKLFRDTNSIYWNKILQNDLTKEPAKRLDTYYWQWEKQRRRTPEYIQGIVNQLKSNDPDTRDRAAKQIFNIGHFAVPYLVEHLKDPLTENGMRSTTTMVLSQMVVRNRGEGVLPIVELLDSSDPLLLENAAIILGASKDRRALAPLKKVFEDPRNNQSVKNFVQYALEEISGLPIAQIPSAKDLYYEKALSYLLNNEDVIKESDIAEGVLYKYRAGDKLEMLNIMEEKDPKYGVPEVSKFSWHLYMAEEAIYDALALDISYQQAIPLLICIYHAQFNEVESRIKDIERLIDRQILTEKDKADLLVNKERLVSVKVISQLSGKEYVYNALALAMKYNLNQVAVSIIDQIKFITDGSEISNVTNKKPEAINPAEPSTPKANEKVKQVEGKNNAPIPAENAESKPTEEVAPKTEEKPAEVVAENKPAENNEANPTAQTAPANTEEKPAQNVAENTDNNKPVENTENKPAKKELTKEEEQNAKKLEKEKKKEEAKRKKEEDARIKEAEKKMTPEERAKAKEEREKQKKLAEENNKNKNLQAQDKQPEKKAEKPAVVDPSNKLYGIAAPLIEALNYKDQRVRYEAAMTIAHLNPKKTFPFADKVVELLALALGEKDQIAVLVIDSDNQRNNKVCQLLRACGFLVVSAENGVDGILYSRSFPSKDLILVAGDLKGKNADRVYAELQADYRTKRTPVSIISDSISKVRMAEKFAAFTHEIFTPDDGKDAYLLTVRKIVETSETPASTKLEKENVAIKAAVALSAIKREGTVFKLDSCFDASIKVLTPPERVDEIRLPLLKAMAEFKAEPVLPAIVETYNKDANAKPIRQAALFAIGEIKPGDQKALEALQNSVANSNDIDLRYEGSAAIGKSNQDVQKVVELLNDLRIKKELK